MNLLRPGRRPCALLTCLLVLPIPLQAAGAAQDEVRGTRPEALRQHDTRTSQAMLESELERAREADDLARVAGLLSQLVAVLIEVGQFERALRLADEAIRSARGTGDLELEAWALGARGDAHFFLARYGSAHEDFLSMHELMLQVGDPFGEANARKNLGVIAKYVGKPEDSVTHLEAAREAFRELGTKIELASTLESLGGTYLGLGDHAKALDVFEEALETARGTGDPRVLQQALIRMAIFNLHSGFPDRSIEPLDEALVIIQRLGMPTQETWVHMVKASALASLGRVDEAIAAQELAVRIAKGLDRGVYYANALLELGALLVFVRVDETRALDLMEEAVSIYESLSLPVTWFIHANMARAQRARGELGLAIERYDRAIEELESVRGGIVSEHFRTTFFEKYRSVYEELIELLLERGSAGNGEDDHVRAFEVLERGKARGLVEAIVEARIDLGWPLDADLGQRHRALEKRLAELQKDLMRPTADRASRKALLERLDDAEDELQRLISEIRSRNPRYGLVRYPEPLSVEGARDLLDPETALVVYARIGEGLFAFLLTDEHYRVLRLDARPDVVEQRVRNYLDLIAQEDHAGWRAVSLRIAEEILEPVRAHLPRRIRSLIVVPDGALHFLPFETLLRVAPEGGGDRFLVEDYNLSYAPSVTALAQLRGLRGDETAVRKNDLVMFANPLGVSNGGPTSAAAQSRSLYESEGLDIPPIPYSVAEANAIRSLAPRYSEIYVGEDASESKVKSLPLDRYRVIHFATHGLISDRWPARSALLLAPGHGSMEDGFLQAREIYQLRLASDLVVLSACRTARGRILEGEGVQGLAQAFLHAGSQAVLASLWEVNDNRTAGFMEHFYEELVRGATKAEALRAAKLAMIHADGMTEPRFWAPFILIGAADEGVALTPAPWWRRHLAWIVTGVVVAVIIGGIPAWRRRYVTTLRSPQERGGRVTV